MKNLTLAFVIVAAAASGCYALLALGGVEKGLAGQISSVFLAGITLVHHALETKGRSPRVSTLPGKIVTFDGFALPCYQMLVYGTFIVLALINVAGFLGGFFAGAAGIGIGSLYPTLIMNGVIAMIVLFFIGRWIGTRCKTTSIGVVTTIGVAFAARTLQSMFDYSLIPADQFELMFRETPSFDFLVRQVLIGTVLFGAVGVIGYWRGRVNRESRYMQFLLKRLPNDVRNTFLGLAYEEALALKKPN